MINSFYRMFHNITKFSPLSEQRKSKKKDLTSPPVQALLKTDMRTANVIALSETVECLTLDRE